MGLPSTGFGVSVASSSWHMNREAYLAAVPGIFGSSSPARLRWQRNVRSAATGLAALDSRGSRRSVLPVSFGKGEPL